MNKSVLLTDSDDVSVETAIAQLDSWRAMVVPPRDIARAIGHEPHVRAVFVTTDSPATLREVIECAHAKALPVVVGCRDETARRRAVEMRAEEWLRLPADAEEIAGRIRAALLRVRPGTGDAVDAAERAEQAQMLYDFMTGLPTLPVMIERVRPQFKERGELVVFYFNFVRYSKIEEIYGWEKLDAVLETTAAAVKEFLDGYALQASRVMVSYTNDDDFIFFHMPPAGEGQASEQQITTMVSRLQAHVAERIEITHGEDIATLFEIYVGLARVYYNPKLRIERLIYRGIREAANAAKSVEQRERARRVDDLRTSLRDRAVYVDYHPIIVADTLQVFGYEALARGVMRSLRSPEVMFDVAAEADLIWELSRLCRSRALEGIETRLRPGELLFLNVVREARAGTCHERVVGEDRHAVADAREMAAVDDFRGRLVVADPAEVSRQPAQRDPRRPGERRHATRDGRVERDDAALRLAHENRRRQRLRDAADPEPGDVPHAATESDVGETAVDRPDQLPVDRDR